MWVVFNAAMVDSVINPTIICVRDGADEATDLYYGMCYICTSEYISKSDISGVDCPRCIDATIKFNKIEKPMK